MHYTTPWENIVFVVCYHRIELTVFDTKSITYYVDSCKTQQISKYIKKMFALIAVYNKLMDCIIL